MSKIDERPKLINAETMPNKVLRLYYGNGEIRDFDVKPWINKSRLFEHLKDDSKFNNLIRKVGYVAFDEKTDFSTEVLYDQSELVHAEI